jgi:uncharacterized protein YjbI with pentapeptide repeats
MANDEHLAILKQGVTAWNSWRDENSNIRPDLKGVDLVGADLREADLKEARLAGADLGKTNLADVDLSGAYLLGTDLRGARLVCAKLSGADLRVANLSGANLSGANLTKANLSEGANLSGANLTEADLSEADLRKANLADVDLRMANLTGANLSEANLSNAKLTSAVLSNANLSNTNLRGADLRWIRNNAADPSIITQDTSRGLVEDPIASSIRAIHSNVNLSNANLSGANLSAANLSGANLSNANLIAADLSATDLSGANLSEADLQGATLLETDLMDADLSGCRVYGVSAWSLKLERTKQQNLIITSKDEPDITVDNIEVAQFIYLMLHNQKVRDVIDTITSKAVLILGRFTDERKAVLDALREELRKRNYVPILFDFNVPAMRDITETISLLARMARFVVADITDAKSIAQELAVIVPDLPSVPVQPLLLEGGPEYSMFEHFKRYPWVLKTYKYPSPELLIASLTERVIGPAEDYARSFRAPSS